MKRSIILIAILIPLLSGCLQPPTATPIPQPTTPAVQPTVEATQPSVTLAPSPTATQFAPGADGVATAYLRAWEEADYLGMYSLLSHTSQALIDKATFTERYLDAHEAATVVEIHTRPLAVLQQGEQAEVAFQLTWSTALLGEIEREMDMPLVYEGGRWAVSWSDALILPELGGGNSLQLTHHTPARANIYDRNGLGLAVEGTAIILGVVPGNIEDEATLLSIFSQIMGLPPEEILQRYVSSDADWYVPIGEAPQDVVAAHIEELRPFIDAGGVDLRERKTRLYRDGGVAPHVVGYMTGISPEALADWQAKGYRGDERVGVSGLESWGEAYLGGARGGSLSLLSPTGDWLEMVVEVPPGANRSIYSTVDKAFQIEVQKALADAIEIHPDGHAGAAVVMEVGTGRILAMASYPDFDPNLFDPMTPIDNAALRELLNNPERPLINRVAQSTYPAASVFKIVTISAALISGAYLPDTRYTCTGVWDRLGPNYLKTDWLEGGHGNITLQQALTFSCDPYFYDVGFTLDQVDSFLIPETARAFGFDSSTGIQGIWEESGNIPDPEWKLATYGDGWARGDSVNMAIGQGFVEVTPLQIVGMLAAVANGGTLYRPLIVHHIGEGGGAPEETLEPEINGQLPLTPEQLAIIQESLYAVTTQTGGTAVHRFTNLTIPVAGKTGTAEVAPVYREDGTLNLEPTAWFAGYAPAIATPDWEELPDQPEIAIAVMVENVGEGSDVAAPIFRRIVEIYYGISPLAPYPAW